MDFSIRKAPAPELDKETGELASQIAGKLSYDDDVGIVKYIDGKKIGVYFAPFSTYLALAKSGKKPKAFGTMGIIIKENEYLLTNQSKKALELPGLGKLVDVPGKRCLSFQGFAMEWEKDPIECAYAEMEEELGLDPDDVVELRREIIIMDNEVILAFLFRTKLEENVIRRLGLLAIDAWEIEEIKFLNKENAREFLKGTHYLGIFDRLVGQ